MTICERLAQAIKDAKKSRKSVCDHIGITASTMQGWFARNIDFPAQYVMPLCKHLDITPQWLLEGSEGSTTDHFVHLTEQERFVIDNMRAVDYEGIVVITNAVIQERRRVQTANRGEELEAESVG